MNTVNWQTAIIFFIVTTSQGFKLAFGPAQSSKDGSCYCKSACARLNEAFDLIVTECLKTPIGFSRRIDKKETLADICQCEDTCDEFGDCFQNSNDASRFQGTTIRPIPVTDAELTALSNELIKLDITNNAAAHTVVTTTHPYQSGGVAPRLLQVAANGIQKPTISQLKALHNVYNPDISAVETITPPNQALLNSFVSAVYATPIMQRTSVFLNSKGFAFSAAEFKRIWFDHYSRNGVNGNKGSSGFENVFMGEIIANTAFIGFHNWVLFQAEESATPSRIQYIETNCTLFTSAAKASIIQNSFRWNKLGTWRQKQNSSMLTGTSPEIELALYTICYFARPNNNCPMKFYGSRFIIKAFTTNHAGVDYVDTAFPVIKNC